MILAATNSVISIFVRFNSILLLAEAGSDMQKMGVHSLSFFKTLKNQTSYWFKAIGCNDSVAIKINSYRIVSKVITGKLKITKKEQIIRQKQS